MLSDGTSIVLQPHSALEYPKTFGSDIREVFLTGEAFFEVKKDAERPFMVHANEIVTRVLGTSFTVRSYNEEDNVLVQVKTGKVSVFKGKEHDAQKPDESVEGVVLMPNKKTDINNRGGFSTDMIGMNYQYPDGTYEQRKQIIRDHELYTKGLLYFYGHDPRVPIQLREEMLKWGYPKNEFVNNGNWSPQLYIREARRMVGSYVMTQANCEGKEVVKDGVGMAAYTMDSHNIQRLVVNDQVKNEGNVEFGGFGPYPIAYNSLIPKATEVSNLFVPVCLSATHIAYGSIRMEPVFMVLAQSSATAAVMALDAKTDVQKIDVVKIQQRLKNDPPADGNIFDILVDNDDPHNVTIKGNWTEEKKGGYGPTFLVNQTGGNENATVRFTPDIPKKGGYTAYIYFPKIAKSSSRTTVTVNDGKRNKEITIQESDIRVEGQTSGEWVSLGTFDLPKGRKGYTEVSSKNADGKVIADAVIWVPAK